MNNNNNTGISAELVDNQGILTPRESEIVLMLCEGLSDKSIANSLAISIKTLQAHLDHVYNKLQIRRHSANTRCAAIATMVARGMVKLSMHTVCAMLIVNLVSLDDAARRVGRVRVRSVASSSWAREV
jgi:DNA-binding CsgD family transcriptional regulator